jgi:tRNA(Arg) A34 adenosine deaminase TadA
MCTMALLHARIKRLFYVHEHRQGRGGCNGRLHVPSTKRLNHSFEVYRITAETEQNAVDEE